MRRNCRRRRLVAAVLVIVGTAAAGAQEPDVAPVTDAMLQNPDPADWLSWRRTLDGWGYSPLDQIDRDNVHQLQLVWAWPLAAGLSQPTPLVRAGVLYIPNPGNSVQALDAATGELLWEYAPPPAELPEADGPRSPSRGSRSIALYGDKVYLNTTEAHIVALDARTGAVAWDHTVADYAPGIPLHQRADRGERQHRVRHDRVPELQERRLLHLRARPRHRGAGVAHVDHCPPRRAGRRHVGRSAA